MSKKRKRKKFRMSKAARNYHIMMENPISKAQLKMLTIMMAKKDIKMFTTTIILTFMKLKYIRIFNRDMENSNGKRMWEKLIAHHRTLKKNFKNTKMYVDGIQKEVKKGE